LNLAVDVLDGGSLRVTWYTSEESTESIQVSGQTFAGDTVALRKNHDLTIVPSPTLTVLEIYTLTVIAVDASGNSNSSSVDFVIDEDESISPSPDEDNDPVLSEEGSDETASIGDLFGEPIVQIALMLVVFLLLVAFIRTRKHELDYSLPVEDDLFDED